MGKTKGVQIATWPDDRAAIELSLSEMPDVDDEFAADIRNAYTQDIRRCLARIDEAEHQIQYMDEEVRLLLERVDELEKWHSDDLGEILTLMFGHIPDGDYMTRVREWFAAREDES